MSSLLVLASIAGCFGSDDDAPDPSPSQSPDPRPGDFRITIRNYTSQGLVGAPVNVTWEVAPTIDDDNATNSSVLVRHTAIHWGNESVAQPSAGSGPTGTGTPTPTITTSTTPTDAAATTHTTATTPTSTSTSPPTTTSTGRASGAADYANETEEQSGPAGTFNESFVVNDPGLLYLRVHAIVGNQSFWSDEVVVNVTRNATLPLGQQHIVEIGKTQPGPVADYAPRALTIKAGDSVVWKNIDALSLEHTATSTQGSPAFNTGNIAKNQVSKPVYFNATGSWTYRCNVHQNTMMGATIVVT